MSDKLTGAIRHITGTDYENLTQGEKFKIYTEISQITYKTIITDLMKDISDLGWSSFIVEPTKFGNGYRILTVGAGDVEDYSSDPTTRIPQTRNLLQDYESVIVDKAQLRSRITLNEAESSFYFKDINGLSNFLSLSRKRQMDTFKLTFQDSMIRIFGNPNWPIKNAKESKDFIALVDKIRSNLKNKVTINGNTIADKVKFIMKFVENVTSLTTDAYNIGDDGTDTFRSALNDVTLNDLVLIMSTNDYIDFSVEVQAPTYHKENFDWPKLKIAKLPIPSGTFWLLDKNAFQISPNRSIVLTDFYPNTIDTDIFYHNWFYMGVYPNAFGLKIDFVTDGSGKDADELLKDLEARYTGQAIAVKGKRLLKGKDKE